jgi:hypothetical protein
MGHESVFKAIQDEVWAAESKHRELVALQNLLSIDRKDVKAGIYCGDTDPNMVRWLDRALTGVDIVAAIEPHIRKRIEVLKAEIQPVFDKYKAFAP